MRKTAILMLMLAVGLGAASVYLARDWLRNQTPAPVAATAEPAFELTTIVVARRPLNFGDTLTGEYLSEIKWPAGNFPEGAFLSIDELIGGENGENRVALRAIQVNEPVLRSKITGFGGKATLSTILQKEMRAVTIRVNDVNGVAGFVLPGDRVDVLLTRDENVGGSGRNSASLITDILLQNQKVLGIDQKANDDEDEPKVARAVTLEVTPIDAQKLALASQVGSLSLALRNQTNVDPESTRTVRIRDLKGNVTVVVQPKPVAATATKPPRRRVVTVARPKVPDWTKITIVRGVESSTEKVLRDKSGNPVSKGSKTTGARDVDEETSDNGSKKLGPTTQDGPKLLIPQG